MNTQKSEIAVIFGDINFDLINTKILTGESALRISLNLKLYQSMVGPFKSRKLSEELIMESCSLIKRSLLSIS